MSDTYKTTSAKGAVDIERLGYRPRAPYRLDVEAFTMGELRRRGSREKVRTTHRYEFHMILCVTRGSCTQSVDFVPVRCAPGSLLVLRAGQAHNFGRDDDWDGWVVLFRPEFLLPSTAVSGDLKLAVELDALTEHLVLRGEELRVVKASIQQMRSDAQLEAPLDVAQALLRHQLLALLTRLSILHGRLQAKEPASSASLRRFKQFRQLVEERLGQWRRVGDYAGRMGCTEKSLGRAVAAAAGTTAKAFIAARITLEAKRLLAHTSLSVAAIADGLGFDEPTNFGKFFRREAGCTPVEFRRRQGAATETQKDASKS